MKKVILAVVVMVATVSMSSAQVFVGGGLGLDYIGGKTSSGGTSYDLGTGFAFSFTPKVGFFLNEDFAFGFELGILSATLKEPSYGSDSQEKYGLTGWNAGTFARYRLAGVDRFSLLLEGSLGVGGLKTKYTYGSTTTEGDPTFIFNIGVLPVLSYSITERLSVEASCNFLRLGFQSYTTKDADDSSEKTTLNTFGLGVNSSTIGIDDYGDISLSNYLNVGIIFKF